MSADDVVTASHTAVIEPVMSASFSTPNPEEAGDCAKSRLLRDALRLSFRVAAVRSAVSDTLPASHAPINWYRF
jgi:hypothetical protein